MSAVLYVSGREFARSVGLLKVPPLRCYELEVKDDAESVAEESCHPSAEILRLFPETDCTVLFGDREVRLAADTVQMFAIQAHSNIRVTVKGENPWT